LRSVRNLRLSVRLTVEFHENVSHVFNADIEKPLKIIRGNADCRLTT
jgi:hypothetical protein